MLNSVTQISWRMQAGPAYSQSAALLEMRVRVNLPFPSLLAPLLSFHSPPFPLPPFPPPGREVAPLKPARGLVECCKLP